MDAGIRNHRPITNLGFRLARFGRGVHVVQQQL